MKKYMIISSSPRKKKDIHKSYVKQFKNGAKKAKGTQVKIVRIMEQKHRLLLGPVTAV